MTVESMKDGKQAPCRVKPAAATAPAQGPPELPAWKAFVVQFNQATQPYGATFGGRVEHLSSGRRERFTSAEDLLAALEKLLAEVGCGEPPSESAE